MLLLQVSINTSNCFSLPLDHGINKSHKKQINSAATDKWLSEFSYPTETWYSFWENCPINHRGWRTSAISVPSWGDREGDLLSTVLIEAKGGYSCNKSLFSFWGLLKNDGPYQGIENMPDRTSHDWNKIQDRNSVVYHISQIYMYMLVSIWFAQYNSLEFYTLLAIYICNELFHRL